MLTFNISVGNHKLPEGFPYQIIPNSRSYLYPKTISQYSGGSNNVVIHVGYPIRPFSDSAMQPDSKIPDQLRLYKQLAIKLNAGYILIHLPTSLTELINFKAGLQLIATHILSNKDFKWNGIVLLETPCFTQDLRKYLIQKEGVKTYEESISTYFSYILPFVAVCKSRVQIILDTAHIFANGCDSLDKYVCTVNLCGKYLARVIHLNGNVNAMYSSDEHIPFFDYTSKNKVFEAFGEDNYNKMIEDAFKRYDIIISENNFDKYEEYNYEAYKKWADEHKFSIIPNPIMGRYAITHD